MSGLEDLRRFPFRHNSEEIRLHPTTLFCKKCDTRFQEGTIGAMSFADGGYCPVCADKMRGS